MKDMSKYIPYVLVGSILLIATGLAKTLLPNNKDKTQKLAEYIKSAKTRGPAYQDQLENWLRLGRAMYEALLGSWYEDETLLYETVSKIRDNKDATEVGYVFSEISGKDLVSEMQRLLSSGERVKVRSILNNKGITAWRV